MRHTGTGSLIIVGLVAAAAGAALSSTVAQVRGQTGQAPQLPRVEGKPNFSGIWQANNEAYYDLESHAALPAQITQQGVYSYDYARLPAAAVVALGATAAIPGSLGVVQGDGKIPYKPEALATKKANVENWVDRDPEVRCYLPGTPRAMYMPYPFQITQSTNKIHLAFSYAATARTIHMDKVEPPPDFTWMGHSVGRWEGDTLVVEVTDFNDRTWFDRAGNYHSDAMKLTERYTLESANLIRYEATIEDPQVFSRPWKIAMPLYRRAEPNMQLIEFRCSEFAEEFMFGHLRRKPVVQHWESATMSIDVKRKIPSGDAFYDWYNNK
jgi:hypothetical protein